MFFAHLQATWSATSASLPPSSVPAVAPVVPLPRPAAGATPGCPGYDPLARPRPRFGSLPGSRERPSDG